MVVHFSGILMLRPNVRLPKTSSGSCFTPKELREGCLQWSSFPSEITTRFLITRLCGRSTCCGKSQSVSPESHILHRGPWSSRQSSALCCYFRVLGLFPVFSRLECLTLRHQQSCCLERVHSLFLRCCLIHGGNEETESQVAGKVGWSCVCVFKWCCSPEEIYMF